MTPIEAVLDKIEWTAYPPQDGDELHATHEGTLEMFGFVFRAYQLSDGRRVIDAEDIQRLFREP
jgi:hypothetical protein